MGEITKDTPYLPPEQQAIRATCFHPSGSFVEFDKEEVEQSIPDRFEQMVRRYPERIAVKTKNYTLTYAELNNMDELDWSLSDENIGLPLSPDTLAYILYTSGSTAQAKGVLQNHRNTLHTIMNYTNAFRVCVYDRLTLLH